MGHQNSFKVLKELMDLMEKTRQTWLQHILLLSTTLFGILISLHDRTLENLYARWSFALAVVLLGFGILMIAISLYAHINTLKRVRILYSEEAITALRENREAGYVGVNERKVFGVCEKIGYICFSLCILGLSLYSFLLIV